MTPCCHCHKPAGVYCIFCLRPLCPDHRYRDNRIYAPRTKPVFMCRRDCEPRLTHGK